MVSYAVDGTQYGIVCYEYGYLGLWKYGHMHNRLENRQLFGLVFLLNDYGHEYV